MEKPNLLPDSPSFVDLCTLHQHAMRYYRLWIYACNTVLAIATLVFTVFAVSVLVDPRITLLTGVELYQPTFVYAYVALILQCGVLQTIGCLGALRLNQRLLNTYWTLLLLLMLGDIFVGLVWAVRLDSIKSSLRPTLRLRLSSQYGVDPGFTQVWDWVQAHEICCGIESGDDFHFNESIGQTYEGNVTGDLPTTGSSPTLLPLLLLPSTCCTFTKRDSISPSDLRHAETIAGHHPDGGGTTSARHHRNAVGSGREYVSSEVNKRHSHQHPPQLFHPTKRRSPRAAAPFQLFKESADSVPAFGSRSHLNARLAQNSTKMTKTDKGYYALGPRKARPRGPGVNSPPTPTPKPLTSSSSETSPVMMMRSEEVQICELPRELLSIEQEGAGHSKKPSPSPSGGAAGSDSVEIPKDTPSQPMRILHYPPHITRQYHILQHRHGCAEKIVVWMDHVTDVLFVLGFCIIVFLKGCFLAILRYEIKEMIQKIRLLNGDETGRGAGMNELIGLTSMGSQEELGGEEVTADVMELDTISPASPPDPTSKTFPHHHHPHHHHHHQNACGGGGVVANSTATSDPPPAGGTTDGKPPAKKGYPPFGNYLNSNNMMYRLQRQMSQQQHQDDMEEDVESCGALLQLTTRRSGSGGGSGEKRNSVSSRRLNSVAIPIPRNGNNNSMAMTTTALVGATSVTGAAPLTSAAAASVLS